MTKAKSAPPVRRTLSELRADPDSILSIAETGALLLKSDAWLAWQRSRRTGPRFIKFGRSVGYRAGDLLEWIEAQRVNTGAAA